MSDVTFKVYVLRSTSCYQDPAAPEDSDRLARGSGKSVEEIAGRPIKRFGKLSSIAVSSFSRGGGGLFSEARKEMKQMEARTRIRLLLSWIVDRIHSH